MLINEYRVIDLPKISHSHGNLKSIKGRNHVRFDIKHVYYLYIYRLKY